MAALCACATVAMPPGGPPDDTPPKIIAFTPDSGAVNVTSKSVDVRFDEVVAEQGLEQYVLLSPSSGDPKVSWHRDRISIEPRGGFRPNTAYRVTILPGLADLRGHRTDVPIVGDFATGAAFPTSFLTGRIFDWPLERPAADAIVEAVTRFGPKDSLVYTALSDTVGSFRVGPLPAGSYEVRGFIDANRNRKKDSLERSATATASPGPPIELLAIQRDTIPPTISGVAVLDSVSIRVSFTRPVDPLQPIQPLLFRVQRADSSEIPITAIVPEAQDAESRMAAERNRLADSLAALDTTRRAAPPTPVAPQPEPAAQPRLRPSLAAPVSGIVLKVGMPIAAGQIVIVSARGIRGLAGNTQPSVRTSPPRPK